MIINKQKKFCYRICHIDNSRHILRYGLCTKHHSDAAKDFIPIGNPDIVDVRDDTKVKIKGYGNIGEYIPFYFTPRSMMLYNIITGFRAPVVPKRKRSEIIVIRCLIAKLSTLGKFFFTDGQANVVSISKHMNNISQLEEIDWQIIQNSDFSKDGRDTDKQRRYQAEFLVHHHIPVEAIESIVVYDENSAALVSKEVAYAGLQIKVEIIKEYFF